MTKMTRISFSFMCLVYTNSYALKGIPITYQPPIPIPGPVVLPVGWKPPQISDSNLNVMMCNTCIFNNS